MLARLLGLCVCALPLSAQTLVKDINTEPSTAIPGSGPSSGFETGGLTYFAASDEKHGNELWATDGTPGGTYLVKDIFPGSNDGDPLNFAVLPDGRVVLTARHPEYDWEVWITDGTEAGTTLLKDVNPGPLSSIASTTVAFDGKVFFFADDGVHGRELWSTDGTPAGTQLFADFDPGPSGIANGANQMLAIGSTLYFSARPPGMTGWALWKTDGTVPGTHEVVFLTPGSFNNPRFFTDVAGALAFTVYTTAFADEVWFSDGTTAGTFPVSDGLSPGTGSSSPGDLYAVGPTLYFSAFVTGIGRELFQTDGTVVGTSLVKDISIGGPFDISSDPDPVGAVAGKLVFSASTPATGQELWITDGTELGTQPLPELVPGAGSPGVFFGIESGGSVYFAATTPGTGRELYSTDGATVSLVQEILPGPADPDIDLRGTSNGRILVAGDDGVAGVEPWVIDGTSAQLLTDINPPMLNLSSAPTELTRVVDRLFFEANDPVAGRELWVSDGTESGTYRVIDLVPGDESSNPGPLAPIGDKLLFFATVPGIGREPWISDGTAAGTQLLTEINPSDGFIGQTRLFPFGPDRVLFTADDGVAGNELWITDGTAAGTTLVKDIEPGGSSIPADFFRFGDEVFFTAHTNDLGRELWKTDGTGPGTVLVKDVYPGKIGGVSAFDFAEFQGELYFGGSTPGEGPELWKSDGTTAGTAQLAVLNPGEFGSSPRDFHEIGGELVFTAFGMGQGRHLWKTDGTGPGTQFLAFGGEEIQGAVVSNGSKVLFFADVGPSNEMLFASDGTAAGTGLIAAIEPLGEYPSGNVFGDPGSGQGVVFRANDGANGGELWVSDGTSAGTKLVVDIAPGGLDSDPDAMVRVGNQLFFAADDGLTGLELHAVDLPILGEHVVETFGAGCPGTGGLVPEIGVVGVPEVGGSFDLTLADGLSGAPALMLFGVDGAIGPIGGGCSLFLAGAFFTVPLVTDLTGAASLTIAPTPAQAGTEVYFQYVVIDPAGAWLGLASSTGAVEVVVGP
ncbi:MAG: ELWxxDGT repeat protein [Planctomycetota bacterium]